MSTAVVTPVPVPTPSTGNSVLDKIFSDLEIVTTVIAAVGGGVNPTVSTIAAIVLRLETVIGSAITAHEALKGQPLDLTKLHQITPVGS